MVSGRGQSAHRLPARQKTQQPTGHLEEEYSPRLEAAQRMSRHEASSGPAPGAGPSRGAGRPDAIKRSPVRVRSANSGLRVSNFKYRSPALICITKVLEARQGLLPCTDIGLNITPGATRFGAIPKSSFPELYFTRRCWMEAKFHCRRAGVQRDLLKVARGRRGLKQTRKTNAGAGFLDCAALCAPCQTPIYLCLSLFLFDLLS